MSRQVMVPVQWSIGCAAAACDPDRWNRVSTSLILNGTRAQVTKAAKARGWHYLGKGAWWCPQHAREGKR